MSTPHYELVVLGRYPSLVSRGDPQVAVEVRVARDHRLANCGTITLRESEWSRFAGPSSEARTST
jgi:hypothetical protein